jgi:leucyl/phenylalanyl-tRNA--protein transferase
MPDQPPNSDPAAITPAQRLAAARLLEAYRAGAFPMAASRTSRRVTFYTADPRAVLPLEPGAMHVPASLGRRVRSGRFTITSDAAFEQVLAHCSAVPRGDDNDSWINPWIVEHYTVLHRLGHAHSVEAWRACPDTGASRLVGGLYGVHIGAAFFGESMFSLPHLGGTDSSKVCLVHLVEHLRRRGFMLLDCQYANAHTARLGVVSIPLQSYLCRLAAAVATPAPWRWEPTPPGAATPPAQPPQPPPGLPHGQHPPV